MMFLTAMPKLYIRRVLIWSIYNVKVRKHSSIAKTKQETCPYKHSNQTVKATGDGGDGGGVVYNTGMPYSCIWFTVTYKGSTINNSFYSGVIFDKK